jgi:hypothetical protein
LPPVGSTLPPGDPELVIRVENKTGVDPIAAELLLGTTNDADAMVVRLAGCMPVITDVCALPGFITNSAAFGAVGVELFIPSVPELETVTMPSLLICWRSLSTRIWPGV